jgi:hypothetical protein
MEKNRIMCFYLFLKDSFEIETIKKYLDENSIPYRLTSNEELKDRFYSEIK